MSLKRPCVASAASVGCRRAACTCSEANSKVPAEFVFTCDAVDREATRRRDVSGERSASSREVSSERSARSREVSGERSASSREVVRCERRGGSACGGEGGRAAALERVLVTWCSSAHAWPGGVWSKLSRRALASWCSGEAILMPSFLISSARTTCRNRPAPRTRQATREPQAMLDAPGARRQEAQGTRGAAGDHTGARGAQPQSQRAGARRHTQRR